MKYILFILMFLFSVNIYSQEIKIMNTLILGQENIEFFKYEVSIDDENVYVDTISENVIVMEIDNFYYKNENTKIIVLIVDNKLYGVRYYPNNDKDFYRYQDYLNNKFKHLYINNTWIYPINNISNPTILIVYDLGEDYSESFIHYDIQLLNKYPEYKEYL